MTRAGKKLIKAAREALDAIKCEHDLEPVREALIGGPYGMITTQCKKCGQRFTQYYDVRKRNG